MNSDPKHGLTVRTLMSLGRIYARGFHQLDVRTPCSLPKHGPAILVSNHTSGVDPVMIQSACPRLIVWMMASEYYAIPSMKWGFEMLETIPVNRSGKDLAATRAALRALESGRILGIFPEGRIEPASGELLPFQPGVAMMAHRAAVDVYPAYLDGTQRGKTMSNTFSHPQSVSLTFGPKVNLRFDGGADGQKPDLSAATAQIQTAVESLRDVASSLHNNR